MIQMRPLIALTTSLACVAVISLHADVKTEERIKFELGGMLGKMVNIFGGKDAREGTVTTVALKGPRLSTMTNDGGQIIDLSEEKIYQVDSKKKNYRVMTFAQIRQQMEEAKAKAEKAMQEEQAKQKDTPAAAPAQKPEDVMEIDFDVKKTGQSRTIIGFNTTEAVVTVTVREKGKTLDQNGGLQITTDMWLAPSIPAMKEIADFQLQYAQKLFGPMIAGASPQDMAAATALYPMLKPAMERMSAELSKIQGTSVLTTVRVEAVKSAAQFAEEQKERQDANKPSLSGGVGGLLGGIAKRAAQKKVEGEPQPRATVMTTTTELLKVATDVAAGDVAIPAGFKQQQ